MAFEGTAEAAAGDLKRGTPRNVQAGLSVVQPINELHAAKMPRLGERAPPEQRLSIEDGAMASKADVLSAAKPNKAKTQVAPRTPQAAVISATQAPIALTAATAMATGYEEVGRVQHHRVCSSSLRKYGRACLVQQRKIIFSTITLGRVNMAENRGTSLRNGLWPAQEWLP